MRRVVSLFLPTWPIDRLRRNRQGGGKAARPWPSDKPLVTVAQDGARRLIAAADINARRAGIEPGLTLAHARALVPDVAAVEADPAADEADLRRLAAWCVRRYSPCVALDPPDGLWIDMTGCAHLFGGEAAMLADLLMRLRRCGVAARAGLADYPGAAWAVARFDARANAPSCIVPPGRAADWLAELPIAALRLDMEAVENLRRLGLTRIAQLQALPRGALRRRYGADLLRRLDQALGMAAEAIAPLIPHDTPYRRLSFAEPIGHSDDLMAALIRLADSLCRDLDMKGLGLRSCDLLVHRADGAAHALRIGAVRPTRDPAHLRRLFAERIETVDPGFGIEAMSLIASRTERLGPRQLRNELATDEGVSDLVVLIDRLANRLGPERVYRLAPVESDLPERSVRRIPPLSPPLKVAWPHDLPRPSRLLQPPEPIEVTALLPDNPPVRFHWRRLAHRVRHADGPERVFGEWWRFPDEVAAVRDYFQIEDEVGQRFWVFRDGAPEAGGCRWYLHGLF